MRSLDLLSPPRPRRRPARASSGALSLLLTLVAALPVVACAESRDPSEGTPPTPDRSAPIDVDLPPDAGPIEVDAGEEPAPVLPAPGEVGAACEAGAECDTGGCFRTFPFSWSGGYCSAGCDSEDDCSDGSTCEPIFTGFAMCLDNCDPEAEARTCRSGYGCAARPTGTFGCLPGCTDDTDCPAGATCAPGEGFLRAGECFTEGAAPGDACEVSSDCGRDTDCFSEAASRWPGGVCATGPCNPDTGAGCPAEAACIPTDGGGGVCVGGCDGSDDCRPGFACEDGACQPSCDDDAQCSRGRVCNPVNGRCTECADDDDCSGDQVCDVTAGSCTAPFDPRDYGRFCDDDDSVCQQGRCLLDGEGYPGSYCVFAGCGELTACPGDGVCVARSGEEGGFCHRPCTEDDDCRSGYACQPADDAQPDGPTACLPADGD